MSGEIEERVIAIAKYILETNATVRQTAKVFLISKSTVHKDVSERLLKINPGLHDKVKEVIKRNKDERHLRGGFATKEMYRLKHLS